MHPGATGRGVGTALLAHLELDAQAHGAGRFNAMQPVADTLGAGLLAGRGYFVINHVLRMAMSLDRYQAPETPLPTDVELVGFDHARDTEPLLAAFREAFPEVEDSDAEWWRDRVASPALPFDPALWSVARQGGELVGFSLGSRVREQTGTVGYISDIGVRPQWRGQGIAYALLTASIAGLAAEGLPNATLNVDADNLAGAIRLYRKAGMRPEPQFTERQKKLDD